LSSNQLLQEFNDNPFDQFTQWYRKSNLPGMAGWIFSLQRAIYNFLSRWAPELERISDNAFSLSTFGDRGPESRIVLLKSYDEKGFVFYTNYDSQKGRSMEGESRVHMLFYEPFPLRQIRISGVVEKTTREESEAYWSTRPKGSQISQAASHQSVEISDSDNIHQRVAELKVKYKNTPVPCPENWGGYRITPSRFEFWVGRASRLHDRIIYERQDNGGWKKFMIQP
tara:strand:- start:5478 stop:6155 length:678 start_codon:yes stop_codon:yes gene_type:complete